MKHVHSLRFETLEARQLLSRAHVHAAVAHAARPAATPVVLNGTLNVDNNPNATTTTTNEDGSMTTSVPVAGQLGALGRSTASGMRPWTLSETMRGPTR